MAKSVKEKVENSKIKINPHCTLKLSDAFELVQSDSIIKALSYAFRYGFIQGTKAAKAEKKVIK